MNPDSALNDVISDYSAWDRPWEFQKHIQEHINLLTTDKNTFLQAWTEATDTTHWQDSDLVLGCKSAHLSIRRKFSCLSEESVGAIVRAVSYQWR